jgi:hypothetical protein
MAKIIKVFKDPVPAMRFIGKKYANFGGWSEWFENAWFDALEAAMGGNESILAIWENGGGYVGLERRAEGEPFEYWIGMFAPAGTPVPDGFSHIDFPEATLGTCWIYGREDSPRDAEACRAALAEIGVEPAKIGGAVYCFENDLCPRFTTPDEEGNVIIDFCYYC